MCVLCVRACVRACVCACVRVCVCVCCDGVKPWLKLVIGYLSVKHYTDWYVGVYNTHQGNFYVGMPVLSLVLTLSSCPLAVSV